MEFFNEHFVFLVVCHIWEARSIDRFCQSGKMLRISSVICIPQSHFVFSLHHSVFRLTNDLSSYQSFTDWTVISKIHLEFLIWRLAARFSLFLYLELSDIYLGNLSLQDVIESLCYANNRNGCFFRIHRSRNQIDDKSAFCGFFKFLKSNV